MLGARAAEHGAAGVDSTAPSNAERRVSNVGSSLFTHIPNWVSRALMAPDEESSGGILRMLSCGSDATPLPEGAAGAYGKLRALDRDAADADATLSGVVTLDARAADAYLLVADAAGVREMAFPSPSYPHLGVLIDVPGERILVGALPFLKSTFVQLMFLDGRYSRLFVKHGTRETSGERIVTWKIRWALY